MKKIRCKIIVTVIDKNTNNTYMYSHIFNSILTATKYKKIFKKSIGDSAKINSEIIIFD